MGVRADNLLVAVASTVALMAVFYIGELQCPFGVNVLLQASWALLLTRVCRVAV